MIDSLEERFGNFLETAFRAESIDALHTPGANDPKMADYYLANRKIVAEVKLLNANQIAKGGPVIDDHLNRKGAVIFGTLPPSRFTDSLEEEEALRKRIRNKMTTRLKKVCSDANKQLAEEFTKQKTLKTGVLILLNERNTSLHPSMVAERVSEYVASQPRNIHYCLMIFESHKVNINGRLLPYPLLLRFPRNFAQMRSLFFLESIRWEWAKTYGHTRKIRSNKRNPTTYYPETLIFD